MFWFFLGMCQKQIPKYYFGMNLINALNETVYFKLNYLMCSQELFYFWKQKSVQFWISKKKH